ncbi:MAG TPA: ATP-binding protein [Candidatus Limnocylindria bacterium]|nr:ATP-binding protein [Candidatus Limnocylindria bacterium]
MEAVSPEILSAYREHDRELTIRKFRLACAIGFVLVPAFNVIDRVVYPDKQNDFLIIRLCCSGLIALFYWLFRSGVGRKFYRVNGLVLFMLPASAITWMIYDTTGASSPYYAGLNLVLMVLAFVLDWTFWESLCAVALVLVLYLTACVLKGFGGEFGLFLNNTAFLASTGVIIITGSYFHGVLRLREFASTYQLDKSRQALAAQNQVLEDTLKQLKETELQLVQTEKIVSLGRLSAGLIHEINNPLNFASTGLYVLRNQGERLAKEKPEEFSEVIQDIDEGLQRVKNIVGDLRSFTHPDANQQEIVKVAEVITGSLRFLSNEWRDKVQIDQAVPPDLLCRANKNKLTQVFVNLIQNALDALRNKPEGTEPPLIRIVGRRENGKVIIFVRDNGEGVETQNMSKIFDPFFTTRDIGKGMGMGLSICYRIIQEHHGSISVTSERGRYCQFTIELPDAAADSIAA